LAPRLKQSAHSPQALGWLLSVPGASGTVLEVVVPYSMASMAQLLGKMPLQFTSKQAAEDMALAAFNRALKLSGPGMWAVLHKSLQFPLSIIYPLRELK
jgi:hypothetical protein